MAREAIKKQHYRVKSVRFDLTHDQDANAYDYVLEQEQRGLDFRKIVVDALNARAGATPEMFAGQTLTVQLIEELLGRFAEDIIQRLPSGTAARVDDADFDDDADHPVSSFGRALARGFLERQKSAVGDEED